MHSLTQDRPAVLLCEYPPARRPLCQLPHWQHRRHRHCVPASIQVRNRLEALVESPCRRHPVHLILSESMPMRSAAASGRSP